jgi:hypothetical protein
MKMMRRLIATALLLVGLLVSGLMAYAPSGASADCAGVGGNQSGSNNVGIGNIGGSGNCGGAPAPSP